LVLSNQKVIKLEKVDPKPQTCEKLLQYPSISRHNLQAIKLLQKK